VLLIELEIVLILRIGSLVHNCESIIFRRWFGVARKLEHPECNAMEGDVGPEKCREVFIFNLNNIAIKRKRLLEASVLCHALEIRNIQRPRETLAVECRMAKQLRRNTAVAVHVGEVKLAAGFECAV
jgi:hypothetical protein